MKKTIKSKMFDPEKYGMVFCPGCNGSGKSFNDCKEANVCEICGGFGLIKKEEKDYFQVIQRLFSYLAKFITYNELNPDKAKPSVRRL